MTLEELGRGGAKFIRRAGSLKKRLSPPIHRPAALKSEEWLAKHGFST